MSLGVFWPLLTSASTVFYDLIFTVLTLLHYQMPAFDEPLPLEDFLAISAGKQSFTRATFG